MFKNARVPIIGVAARSGTGKTTLLKRLVPILRSHGLRVAFVKHAGGWQRKSKPVPDDIDEWTHYLHNPSNNAVARDASIDFPRHLSIHPGGFLLGLYV